MTAEEKQMTAQTQELIPAAAAEIKKRRTGCSRTLLEMSCAIVMFEFIGFCCWIWFVPQKWDCALGLLLGTLTALAMAYHMSWVLDRYLGLPPKIASRRIVLHSMIRYAGAVAVLFLIMYSGIANPITAFVGIMGLKIGAYLQPLIHRFTVRKYPDPEPAPALADEDEDDTEWKGR